MEDNKATSQITDNYDRMPNGSSWIAQGLGLG